ncbi:sigma factor-like helix-turn-helix DNA-binding protein [Streptomyces griseoincarnatus]
MLTSEGALGPLETAEQRDTVSLAFLVLAERLTPGERAVFVLREAFGYSHREVAELVGLSESNCRQLHSRARKRLSAARLPPSANDDPTPRVGSWSTGSSLPPGAAISPDWSGCSPRTSQRSPMVVARRVSPGCRCVVRRRWRGT